MKRDSELVSVEMKFRREEFGYPVHQSVTILDSTTASQPDLGNAPLYFCFAIRTFSTSEKGQLLLHIPVLLDDDSHEYFY